MNTKVIGAMLAAAFVGVSANSFAQGSGASGQDTPREAASATAGPGHAGTETNSGAMGDRSTDSRSSASMGSSSARCDAMMGDEKMRCMNAGNMGQGQYTQTPGDSGPGTNDKTHPGLPAGDAASKDVGTSSAGSGR